MYTRFFGLRCLPFEDRAEAQFFYSAAECEETLAAMEYEAHYGTGIGLVLGEAGTGKTLLIRVLLSRLHATDHVVVITAPANGAAEIVRECCKGFGVSLPSAPNEPRRINRLRRHLGRTLRASHRSILVVDQAEHLTSTNLNEIGTLADLQADEGRLLSVILAGHPRFRSLLNQPDFVRVRQLAFKEHVLSPLTASETKDYIAHRLRVAGAGEVDILGAGALALIQASSGGIPRLINQVCNAAMLAAYGAGESRISASIVAEVTGVAAGAACEETRAGKATACASNWPEPAQTSAASPEVLETASGGNEIAPIEATWSRSAHSRALAAGAVGSQIDLNLAAGGPTPGSLYAASVESRLLSLIERAERTGDLLTRNMTQAADSTAQAKRRVDRLVDDAEERVREMESRLADAVPSSNESSAKVQRVERACKRAEEVESRITGFAELLADRVDDVQARAGQLLEHIATIEEARVRVEETIARANVECGEAQRNLEEWSSRLHQERETAERSIREIVSAGVAALEQRAASAALNAEAIAGAAHSRLDLEVKEAMKARDESAKSALDELRQTIQAMRVEFEKQAGAAFHNARTELAASMSEAQARSKACREAESQLAAAIAETGQIRDSLRRNAASADESARGVTDATRAGEHLLVRLGEATADAEKIHERTIQAATAAQRTVAEADQTLERLKGLQIDTNVAAARLDSDSTTARQVVEALAGLVAAADQKIGQLSSTHSAASHLRERLAATLVSGHQFVERADESVHCLEQSVADADAKVKQLVDGAESRVRECAEECTRGAEKRLEERDAGMRQLADKVVSLTRECTAQMARWDDAQTAIAEGEKRLQEVSEAGSHLAVELALLVEQGGRAVSALNAGVEQSRGITQRVDAFAGTLETAGGLEAGLQRVLEGGRALQEELASVIAESGRQRDSLAEANSTVHELLQENRRIEQAAKEATERADARVASLGEVDAALHALMQKHGQLEHSAEETVERLGANLGLLKETMEAGEPLLNEYLSRIGHADEKLARFDDRAATIERRIAEGTGGAKAIVINAQAQAEHLERVCTAVQKVFAGLSQSSLQAREQTEGLRRAGVEAKQQLLEFTTETQKALNTLHEWLREALRVQARLEQALQQSPSVAETHSVEPLHRTLRRLGTVERTATLDIESEPGAVKAREVEPEFDRKAAREGTSRADAIARLIAEAKHTKPVAAPV